MTKILQQIILLYFSLSLKRKKVQLDLKSFGNLLAPELNTKTI